MFFKESESLTVPCPFFREIQNEEAVKALKELPIYVHSMCKGSACKAAWTWKKTLMGAESKTEGCCGFSIKE
ncbi:MAG: hypothetical protein P4L79_10430 [Legionella sp.]|nr:hypothetical protein [Legionella sp.]